MGKKLDELALKVSSLEDKLETHRRSNKELELRVNKILEKNAKYIVDLQRSVKDLFGRVGDGNKILDKVEQALHQEVEKRANEIIGDDQCPHCYRSTGQPY